MAQYVALLRGINVGGNNLVKMSALKACFEEHGFGNVATYIASGNVLFESKESRAKLVKQIEAMLTATFGYPASVVVRSHRELKQIVERAPDGFGKHPGTYRYDALFLKDPLRATAAIKRIHTREGVDQVSAGSGVLYFSRLIARITQSQMNRIVSDPIYKSITLRNWNTTTRLLALMEKRAEG